MASRGLKVGAEDGNRALTGMPSFVPSVPASNSIGAEGNGARPSRNPDFGLLEQSLGFRIEDAMDLSRHPIFSQLKSNSQTHGADVRVGPSNKSIEPQPSHIISVPGGHTENWGETNMPDASPRTDTSTDDTEDKNQRYERGQSTALAASDSSDRSKEKVNDQKTLRRLAQNREAARKSRLRKKAYVQQLESSRLKLTQLEQELQRARQQGIFISSSGDQANSNSGNAGALAFDAEYARWLEERNRHVSELRNAVNSHVGDTELRTIVDGAMSHFEDIFRLKGNAAKSDVFHILSGMWKTPAERCFMWIGGFRSSDVLKLLVTQLPLTEQQLVGICNLQQSSQQAEDALSQGMEQLQQSLAETLANGSPSTTGSSGVANYMGQMAMAMGKLGTLEGFLRQADNLRQQTLQQMHRILTTRQSARAILAIHDYFSRLRALSSLWLARPRE